jgi:YwiC-like protein
MLLVPMATGAAVATGPDAHYGSLGLLVVVALALFWARTPLEAALGTLPIKARSTEERSRVLAMALLLAAVGTAAITLLFNAGYAEGLLLIGTVAAAAFLLQTATKAVGRRGRMPAQVIGAIGLTATAAAAYYVTSGRLDRVACALWTANWLFAGNQVHFVQVRIRGSRAETVTEKLQQAYGFVIGQALLLACIGVGTRVQFFPKFTVLAFIPALVRGSLWFVRSRQPLDVHKLGFSELRHTLLFAALLIVSFRI